MVQIPGGDTGMTKKQARALLVCRDRINKALDSCLAQLSYSDQEYAKCYWAAHIRSAINGTSYGAAYIEEAEEKLESGV
jgi:hypothetical protein